MKPLEALWLALWLLGIWLVSVFADETTSHAPAPVHAIAAAHDEVEVSRAAKQVWTELAMRADGDRAWALLVRGSLFTGRGQGGRA